MENTVGVTRGSDKIAAFRELLNLTGFDENLDRAYRLSGEKKGSFRIAIKPNMMVFVNHDKHTAVVTDKDLVECLIDHIAGLGFSDISVCESQHDVGRMLKNHTVEFVSRQIGYRPGSRYRVVDLTLESVPHRYAYVDRRGRQRTWKDVVGKTWRDADYRISFAKCKSHEHDWMTLSIKNVYGCFPAANKVERYHISDEVWDVTARSLASFPVHFAFVDAWIASDGFQGYKIPHPKELRMLFGGSSLVAVDMEAFGRAGLDFRKSRFLKRAVEQLSRGEYPRYDVAGDRSTQFRQVAPWENVGDAIVESTNVLEEVYIAWGFINLKGAADMVDYSLFPPRNIFFRFLVCATKALYSIAGHLGFYRKLYGIGK